MYIPSMCPEYIYRTGESYRWHDGDTLCWILHYIDFGENVEHKADFSFFHVCYCSLYCVSEQHFTLNNILFYLKIKTFLCPDNHKMILSS